MDINARIQELISNNQVMLFMKGTPDFPQCGFSAKAVAVFRAAGVEDIGYVNIFEDTEVYENIKQFSNWPTLPQAYVNGEFLGGSDILVDMYERGELQPMLQASE